MIARRDESELRASYKWLRDRIKAEVPDIVVAEHVSDFGSCYAIGVQKGSGEQRKRHAVRVEFYETVGGVLQELEDEEGNKYMGYGPPYENVHYSLNADPEKEAKAQKIIKRFKQL